METQLTREKEEWDGFNDIEAIVHFVSIVMFLVCIQDECLHSIVHQKCTAQTNGVCNFLRKYVCV